MGKYFGTDGVRGVANQGLTPELAYKLGRIGAYVLTKEMKKPTIVIGRDTRISGEMLESAMIAGMLSIGANVLQLGIITTPGVAYLTRQLKADAGVMISASHNPVKDNGIKFFGADGFKLSDETENEIEMLLDKEIDKLPRPIGGEIGRLFERYDAKVQYISYLKSTINTDFKGLKIVLDTANGAAYEIAPTMFKELGATVVSLFNQPDGLNINDGCGSTHPEKLMNAVKEHQADIGLAYDGDADRLIAVDEKGKIIDGDYIMMICGKYLAEKGKLENNTIVSTVMSNIGFYKAVEENGLQSVQTKVGDRYVMEAMRKHGLNLGGEQSGHIIFLDYNTTGDGILSSIQLVNVMKEKGKSLSELASIMKKYPQVLENVRVTDKSNFANNKAIEKAIKKVEDKLGNDGRVLVRPSGTEPLIRVMAEGPNEDLLKEYVKEIVEVVKNELS
ncbi:phosphoglucosamine mutase [Vulcanibacillus modesticaldus]|uniref:Phosphoglucosamine mutase n=1 Tax=Vulcanibacillus modesticaldus TaxID=337097 RepID=A0A1D2YWU5_9BACI|nr:phosphoglucosamine mutase [Vulcanibacillus modesticaldus]OEG00235.1 phosphoglucosamine mutase [Vulcanibacillus modesticaldus]